MAGENATEAETADHGIPETLAAIQDQCDLPTIVRRIRDYVRAIGGNRLPAGVSQEQNTHGESSGPGDSSVRARKFAAASKGRLILRYSTADKLEPIHPPTLDEAGCATRTQLVRPTARPAVAAGVIGDEPPAFLKPIARTKCRGMPKCHACSRRRRADTGEPWSEHRRKLSGFDLVFSPHESVSLASGFAATPAGTRRSGSPSIATDGPDPGAVGWISFGHSYRAADAADPGRARRPDLLVRRGGRRRPAHACPYFLMNLVATAAGRIGRWIPGP
jgi:hypothetical protein